MKTKVIKKRVHNFLVRKKFLGSKSRAKRAVLIVLIVFPFIITIYEIRIISVNSSSDPLVTAHKQGSLEADKGEATPSPSLEKKTVSMSAYTSRAEETDSSPCISADGTNICKYDGCVVASNDYPFDTVLVVEGFGECVVKDRMSSRYTGTGNMDMYFGYDLEGALQFGRQNLKIKITS